MLFINLSQAVSVCDIQCDITLRDIIEELNNNRKVLEDSVPKKPLKLYEHDVAGKITNDFYEATLF